MGDQREWKPGALVVRVSGAGEYGPIYRISKVYKNGNLILEGDTSRQQWTPSSIGVARPTGNIGFHPPHLLLIHDGNRDEIDRERRKAGALRMCRRLADALRSIGGEEALLVAEEAHAILKALKRQGESP